jgi:hypothetical protein
MELKVILDMKRIFLNILIIASLLSCSKKSNLNYDSVGTPIRFYSNSELLTKSNTNLNEDGSLKVQWSEEDMIGIYGQIDGRSVGDNYAYVVTPNQDNASNCSLTASNSSKIFLISDAAEQGYFAYFPYEKFENVALTPSQHPIKLSSVQIQNKVNSPEHISKYSIYTSTPQNIKLKEQSSPVNFVFSNLYSIVEFKLKMADNCPIKEVPIKQLKLNASRPLSINSGYVDLTLNKLSETSNISIENGVNEVVLSFDTDVCLSKNEFSSFYMIVAPGQHSSETLRLTITAIDNSTYTIDNIPTINFIANKHYVQEYTLDLNVFEVADPFIIDMPTLTCKVDEPLTINFSGKASEVELWTGEIGHDYVYSGKDRFIDPDISFNFKMLLNSGVQRHPLSVKYSRDYNGGNTEADVLSATWYDVSDEFSMTTTIYTVDIPDKVGENSVPKDAGTVNCSKWFEGDDRSCYIAFFYHVDKYDENYLDIATGTQGNGRTYVYLYDCVVRSQFRTESIFEELYKQSYVIGENNDAYPVYIKGSTFGAEDGTNPIRVFNYMGYNSVIRFGSAFRPTIEKNSYLILPKITKPNAKNVGPDTPIIIKSELDSMPSNYTYVFSEPGIYKVKIIGTVLTLYGKKEIIKESEIVVTK